MIEKRKKPLGAGRLFGALLTDLSAVFYCLPHEQPIVKLHSYGVDIPSLKVKAEAKSDIELYAQFMV